MAKVELRYQRVSDANRFFEILNNPNFIYFKVCPKDIEGEKEFLRQNSEKRKKNIQYNYAILLDGKLIGGCGININQFRTFIGEIGYFIDEGSWGKGIATKAIKLLEKIGFQKLGLKRLEILMDPRNRGSEKVAINCGYSNEGTMKKATKNGDEYTDAHLYAKVTEIEY